MEPSLTIGRYFQKSVSLSILSDESYDFRTSFNTVLELYFATRAIRKASEIYEVRNHVDRSHVFEHGVDLWCLGVTAW